MPEPSLSSTTVARVREIFERSAFVTDLGVSLEALGPGWCETSLAIQPRHLQQNGFVHAGAQATLADHTAGAAASALVPDDMAVLSIEFKINLLRPAVGRRMRCRADVLRGGRTVSVVEAAVYAGDGDDWKLTAKATVTLAVVPIPSKEQA
ncbi:MAG TPA: PaaI family thioesterase [Herpetosiphonaceae bacterium]|nr:PaaI family thioesterase [Herpetosiphonaceae bacterium]